VRKIAVFFIVLTTTALSASAGPVSVLVGLRMGLAAGPPDVLTLGGRVDFVFEGRPLHGYLAATISYDYGYGWDSSTSRITLGWKFRPTFYIFTPYGQAGLVFGRVHGDRYWRQDPMVGGGLDVRVAKPMVINAYFESYDFGDFGFGGGVGFYIL
jgi:hypothetical protein